MLPSRSRRRQDRRRVSWQLYRLRGGVWNRWCVVLAAQPTTRRLVVQPRPVRALDIVDVGGRIRWDRPDPSAAPPL